MATPEKIFWINKHAYRGLAAEIAKKKEIPYSVVYDILKGKLNGERGAIVLQDAERRIRKRLRQNEADKKRFV